jgi:plastocyanin
VRRRLFAVAGLAAAVLFGLSSGAYGGAYGGGGQQATVNLSEFKIIGAKLRSAEFGKPSVLKPGQTTFTVRNKGQFPHNFVIVRTSKGGTKFATKDIAPGKSAQLTVVDLKPGAYLAVCTVFNGFHYSQGMVLPFTVGTQAQDGTWGP